MQDASCIGDQREEPELNENFAASKPEVIKMYS